MMVLVKIRELQSNPVWGPTGHHDLWHKSLWETIFVMNRQPFSVLLILSEIDYKNQDYCLIGT